MWIEQQPVSSQPITAEWSEAEEELFRVVHSAFYHNYFALSRLIETKTCKQVCNISVLLPNSEIKTYTHICNIFVLFPDSETKTYNHICNTSMFMLDKR